MDTSQDFPHVGQSFLQPPFLVPPHLRPVEPPSMARHGWPPTHYQRIRRCSIRRHEDSLHSDSQRPSPDMRRFARRRIMGNFGLGGTVQSRHGDVNALHCPCNASFVKTQDAADVATD